MLKGRDLLQHASPSPPHFAPSVGDTTLGALDGLAQSDKLQGSYTLCGLVSFVRDLS